MQFVSIFGFFAILVSLTLGENGSILFQKECKNSSECAVYPDVVQGPELIWAPLFCNENHSCGCPNGWIPFVSNNICISKVSDSTGSTLAAYIRTISFPFVILIAVR